MSTNSGQRAVMYCRQSDSDGAGERSLSLDSQARILRDDAARFGWSIVDEIRDADLKGYDDKRPGLLTLYERCRAGDVDVVAFWKLDRLARSLRLQENILHELSQLGVEVWSNQDPHIGTPLFRHVLGAFNEELTRMISANVRRALRERARRGHSHGRPPFGYCRPEKDGPIAPSAAAETVRLMFGWRAEGDTMQRIAERLHEAGIATPRGAAVWSRPAVRYILANPVYVGRLALADVSIDDAHEAIIDGATWERVQQMGQHNGHAPRRKADSSWLEGLIRHACGLPMYLTPRGERSTVFRCRSVVGSTELDHLPCQVHPRQMVAAHAEALAWRRLTDDLASLVSWRRVLTNAKAGYRAATPNVEATRRAAEDRLTRAEGRRGRWLELYASGDIDRAKLDRELTRVAGEITEAHEALAALPTAPDADAIEAGWQALRTLRAGMGDILPADRAILLRRLGVAVASPAGHRIRGGKSSRGPGIDAGVITIRYHAEWRLFFPIGED